MRPIAELCFRIDLRRLFKSGKIVPAKDIVSIESWVFDGRVVGRMRLEALMSELGDERLILRFWRGDGWSQTAPLQVIKLVATEAGFGGKRWWMLCPATGRRCLKLFRPNHGQSFASGKAWRVSYTSQRLLPHDRPFEQLFRLQRKLSSSEGYEQPLARPKGMWRRTFERHRARYEALSEECDRIMSVWFRKL